MKILDLFCGAGGAAVGLHRHGRHTVVGVDWRPQPEYPLRFLHADATRLSLRFLRTFDLIWASPPCQAYTWAARKHQHLGKNYPDLIARTREHLMNSGVPFVIENVPAAPVRQDVVLCGEMFGIGVIRHRAFELHGITVPQPPHVPHRGTVRSGAYVTVAGHGGDGKAARHLWQHGMGMFWARDKHQLAQAVPPAYAEYIIKHAEPQLRVFYRSYPPRPAIRGRSGCFTLQTREATKELVRTAASS